MDDDGWQQQQQQQRRHGKQQGDGLEDRGRRPGARGDGEDVIGWPSGGADGDRGGVGGGASAGGDRGGVGNNRKVGFVCKCNCRLVISLREESESCGGGGQG